MVNVNMGIPLYGCRCNRCSQRFISPSLSFSYERWNGTKTVISFFMTNPHTVIFVDRLQEDNIMDWGEQICHHPLFQDGTNVDLYKL